MKRIFAVAAFWATAPVSVPVLGVLYATEIAFVYSERQLRRRMKLAHRIIHLRAIRGGTIIHDHASFSWGISRLWWTPDDVLANAPARPLSDEQHRAAMDAPRQYRWHEFDRWVWQRYLDSSAGTAFLIGVWHPDRLLRRARSRYPDCRIVDSFSGGRAYETYCREMEKLRAESVVGTDDDGKGER